MRHAVSCLPSVAVDRICDGKEPGSHRSIPPSERSDRATDALSTHAGKAGGSLSQYLHTLAQFADFAAAGGFRRTDPVHIFEVDTLSPSLCAGFVAWQRARGFSTGAVDAATSALTTSALPPIGCSCAADDAASSVAALDGDLE